MLKETEGISRIFVASLHRRTCRCASCISNRAVYVHTFLRQTVDEMDVIIFLPAFGATHLVHLILFHSFVCLF